VNEVYRPYAHAVVYTVGENEFRECFKDNNWRILIFQGANWLSPNIWFKSINLYYVKEAYLVVELVANHYPSVDGFYPCPEYNLATVGLALVRIFLNLWRTCLFRALLLARLQVPQFLQPHFCQNTGTV